MLTAKDMRWFFGDNSINKKLDGFLNSVMMDAMLKQKPSPIDIDLSDIQKFVGSKRIDLANIAIEMLNDNGYSARVETRIEGDYGITVVRVWW